MSLVYSSLNDQLKQRFPNLADKRYTELIGDIEAGPYIVFGVIFNHYLLDLVDEKDDRAKEEVAAFLEELSASSDNRVTDLFTSEVLPTLVGKQATINSFWPWLGAKTRHRLSLLPPKITSGIDLPSSG